MNFCSCVTRVLYPKGHRAPVPTTPEEMSDIPVFRITSEVVFHKDDIRCLPSPFRLRRQAIGHGLIGHTGRQAGGGGGQKLALFLKPICFVGGFITDVVIVRGFIQLIYRMYQRDCHKASHNIT